MPDLNNAKEAQDAVKACEFMHLCLQLLGDHLQCFERYLPAAQAAEIARLGHAMWNEIAAAKHIVLPKSDEAFLQFKAKVAKKPRKNSRLYKEML